MTPLRPFTHILSRHTYHLDLLSTNQRFLQRVLDGANLSLDCTSFYMHRLGGTTVEVRRKDVFGDTHLVASSRQPAQHIRFEQWLCLNCTYYCYYHNVPVVLVR